MHLRPYFGLHEPISSLSHLLAATAVAGAYYFLADFTDLSDKDDVTFAKWMTKEVGVATVPGSSFFRPGAENGKQYIRFAFCKKHETLEKAVERLSRLKATV